MDREELGRTLRHARERLHPEDVGLLPGRRRRVPGLRREEVALLAGMSVDYVVRLEQGRGPRPSASVLGSLARALRLDVDERDRVFRLAGGTPPLPGRIDSNVRPSVLRLLDRFTDLPAMVLDAKGGILAWNELAVALLGDWSAVPEPERNLNWMRFLGEGGRLALSPEEDARAAAQSVAGLRSAAARYPQDPGLHRLIAQLRSRSPRFEALWANSSGGAWRSHRKTVVHPEVGPIMLDCDALILPDTDQVMIVYSAAAGSPEAEALRLLRVIGTQRLDA